MLNKRQSVSDSPSATGSVSASASASSAPSSPQPSSLALSTGPLTSASPTSPASSATLSPSSAIPVPSSSPVTTPLSTVAPSSSPSPLVSSSRSSPSSAAVPTSTLSRASSFVSSAADRTSSIRLDSPISTFSSTVFLQTTNSLGKTTSFAPLEITSTFTSTLGNGGVVTFTEVVANPTLSADNRVGSGTQFFRNKGAVAAVFLIVGLAAATICLWIFFFIRRRRRRRRIEHESAVSASLAAAGYNRELIDDEDFSSGPGMRQRYGSFSSQPAISTPITDDERAVEAVGPTVNLFDPYVGYSRPVGGTGYIPARSESPSQHGRAGMLDDSYASGVSKRVGSAHVPHYNMRSSDQLLAGMVTPMSTTPEGAPGPSQITPPLRNPKRQQSPGNLGGSGLQGPDERPPPDYPLKPVLNVTQRAEKKGWQELRDDVDSRPVVETGRRKGTKG